MNFSQRCGCVKVYSRRFFNSLVIIGLSSVLFVAGLFLNIKISIFAVLLLWFLMIIVNFTRDRITFLAFLITFFSFLLGTLAVFLFNETLSRLAFRDGPTLRHMLFALFLALVSFDFASNIVIKTNDDLALGYRDNSKTEQIRKAAKLLFLVTFPFDLALVTEKVLYVAATNSYTSYYVNFVSQLPSFFGKISNISVISFFVYLGTLPNIKKEYFPFLLYLLKGLLGGLFGQRNQIVMAFLFCGLYVIIYENYIGKPYSILKRRYYTYALIIFPIFLVLMEAISFTRDSYVYEYQGIWNSVTNMLNSLGDSSNVIGYGYELRDILPKKFYSLGGITDFITKNIFAQKLFGTVNYHGNTVEMALYGNSFGQTLTYYVWGPSIYLSGRGMGSCYIAEAFHDFWYFGIVAYSMIYGILLGHVSNMKYGKVLHNTILLMTMYYILYSPRDSASCFISCFFNFSFVLTIILIYVLSKIFKSNMERI